MITNYRLNETDLRQWGKWTVTAVSDTDIEKILEINPGKSLSLQRHKYREESWKILKGSGIAIINGKTYNLTAGDVLFIPIEAWHTVSNTGSGILEIHETQRGSILDENDIERKTDINGGIR